MSHDIFPERVETERLELARLSTPDTKKLYELVRTGGWASATADHMPWFDFDRSDKVCAFPASVEEEYLDAEVAGYGIRPLDGEPDAGDLVGFTRFEPEWKRNLPARASSSPRPHRTTAMRPSAQKRCWNSPSTDLASARE